MCLMLMANTAEDAIVNHVLPFVQQYMTNDDWRYRDAAVYALGMFESDALLHVLVNVSIIPCIE